MKTSKRIGSIILLLVLALSSVVKAEEIKIPLIKSPQALEEGTQRELSPAQVAELLPWAKDSKVFLKDLLDNVQALSTTDKIDRLLDGVKTVVGESAPKNSELLMRYTLNRGLVISDIITRETSETTVGVTDLKLRILRASIKLAIKYYDADMASMTSKTPTPFIVYGSDYFEFLTDLNKSIFDASAQYAIQRTALEWLQWDLYRDINNTSYASWIVKINNSLKTFPNKRLGDAQSIAYIRQMKTTIAGFGSGQAVQGKGRRSPQRVVEDINREIFEKLYTLRANPLPGCGEGHSEGVVSSFSQMGGIYRNFGIELIRSFEEFKGNIIARATKEIGESNRYFTENSLKEIAAGLAIKGEVKFKVVCAAHIADGVYIMPNTLKLELIE